MQSFSHRLEKPHTDITITLPDGTQKPGKAWETTPMNIAEGISKGLAQHVLVARVRPIFCTSPPGCVRRRLHRLLLCEDGGGRRSRGGGGGNALGPDAPSGGQLQAVAAEVRGQGRKGRAWLIISITCRRSGTAAPTCSASRWRICTAWTCASAPL